MKKFILAIIAINLFASLNLAQTRKPAAKPNKPPTIEIAPLAEISDAEWKLLTVALQAEDWEKSATLAALDLKKLTADNDKKQLARLRYFYLYALAGKILALSSAANKTVEADAAWTELDAAIGALTGKEFVMPPRRFLTECKQVVNYVCRAKDSDRVLRVAATNRAGTAIHSFDYVSFDEKISDLESFAGAEVFLGGRLKRAEFNQDVSKSAWVMRLIFENGFVTLAANGS